MMMMMMMMMMIMITAAVVVIMYCARVCVFSVQYRYQDVDGSGLYRCTQQLFRRSYW